MNQPFQAEREEINKQSVKLYMGKKTLCKFERKLLYW